MTAFFTGPAIAWGPGAIEQLSGLGARRALLLVDPAVARAPTTRRVVEELGKAGTVVETVDDVRDLDSVAVVEALRPRAVRFAPDWVVAVGGGRTIDGAKAVRLALECPALSFAALPAVLPWPDRPTTLLAAIPTTSGSGAEASGAADLTAGDGGLLELSDRRLGPEWALVDPAFAASVPPDAVVPFALQALAQAAEAYLSAWSNPFSDALALDVVATVARRLPHAVRWSDDPDARAALHYAATAAGLAASNAQRGVAHALARALTGPTGLGYARLLALALPAVLEFDRPGARDRLEQLGAAAAAPDERVAVPLATRLRRLEETLRCPADLRSAGVPAERLGEVRATVVERTLRSPAVLANPRVPSADDVGALLDAIGGYGAAPRGPAP